ncbi:AAA family ATPase [archaeon]|jgi:CMP/dCMP kinase|nr:AAA family ATPase [archaeon]MBT4021889.1 AAA family ATPase [archaeon]MBT4272184.1 AAA family ATPase [archaeon]MBT4461706.1 AAA family ATPase [archaeon]MBT4858214.1 AAA family ATPase [archaeon]
MIITIAGTAGSGKSSVAKLLAKKLNLKHYSVGDFRREQASKIGLTLYEYNKLGEKKAFTDNIADEWQETLGKNEKEFIIDGRLSFHFIPHSYKIFLDADEKVRAQRIFGDTRKTEQFKSFEEALDKVQKRQESDKTRYIKYYKINPFDYKFYDLVVNTTNMSVEEVINFILEKIHLNKN